jgi:hypothetical protein
MFGEIMRSRRDRCDVLLFGQAQRRRGRTSCDRRIARTCSTPVLSKGVVRSEHAARYAATKAARRREQEVAGTRKVRTERWERQPTERWSVARKRPATHVSGTGGSDAKDELSAYPRCKCARTHSCCRMWYLLGQGGARTTSVVHDGQFSQHTDNACNSQENRRTNDRRTNDRRTNDPSAHRIARSATSRNGRA